WCWTAGMGTLLDRLTDLGIDRFTLVPCGWLGILPLHAAWTPDPALRAGRRYADEIALVTYAPNALARAAAAERARERPLLTSVVVVDNPDPFPGDSERLVSTTTESAEIRKLVGGELVLTGEEAAK